MHPRNHSHIHSSGILHIQACIYTDQHPKGGDTKQKAIKRTHMCIETGKLVEETSRVLLLCILTLQPTINYFNRDRAQYLDLKNYVPYTVEEFEYCIV